MSCSFKKSIIAQNKNKSFYIQRIAHCILVCLEDDDDLKKIKQETNDDVRNYKILDFLFSGASYDDAAEKFNLTSIFIKGMFKRRIIKTQSIVIAFKYEKNIPFDVSIYKVFNLIRNKFVNKEV